MIVYQIYELTLAPRKFGPGKGGLCEDGGPGEFCLVASSRSYCGRFFSPASGRGEPLSPCKSGDGNCLRDVLALTRQCYKSDERDGGGCCMLAGSGKEASTKLPFKTSFLDQGGLGSRFVVGECYENIRIAVMYHKASVRFNSEVSGLPVKGSVVGGLTLIRGCLYPGRTAQRLERIGEKKGI